MLSRALLERVLLILCCSLFYPVGLGLGGGVVITTSCFCSLLLLLRVDTNLDRKCGSLALVIGEKKSQASLYQSID